MPCSSWLMLCCAAAAMRPVFGLKTYTLAAALSWYILVAAAFLLEGSVDWNRMGMRMEVGVEVWSWG